MVALISPLLILFAGVVLLAALAAAPEPIRRRQGWGAAVVLVATLVAILLQGQAFEVVRPITNWSSRTSLTPGLALQGNRPAGYLGLALILAALAAVLGRPEDCGSHETRSWRACLIAGLRWLPLFASLATAWLAFLPANLLTLALAWALLDGVLAAAWLLVIQPTDPQQRRLVVVSWGAGVAGTFCLWGAALLLPADQAGQQVAALVPPGAAGTALTLAALFRLAPFPFHRLQASVGADERRLGWDFVLRAASAAAGIWLVARPSSWGAVSPLWQQVATTLLLTGLVATSLLAWLAQSDRRLVGWVLTGQAGMVVLAGLWASPEAGLAEGMALILGGTLLTVMAADAPLALESMILTGIGLAGLAGLPPTWGGHGRLWLYARWLAEGWGLYLVLASGAWLLFLGAAGRLWLKPHRPSAGRVDRVVAGLGVGLAALALVLRNVPWTGAPQPVVPGLLAWLAALVPVVGGGLFVWGAPSLRPLQQEVTPWLQPILTLEWLGRLGRRVIELLGQAFGAIHGLMEGEGALFWALAVLAIGWLLLTAGGAR